jgi:hypothetical protein
LVSFLTHSSTCAHACVYVCFHVGGRSQLEQNDPDLYLLLFDRIADPAGQVLSVEGLGGHGLCYAMSFDAVSFTCDVQRRVCDVEPS